MHMVLSWYNNVYFIDLLDALTLLPHGFGTMLCDTGFHVLALHVAGVVSDMSGRHSTKRVLHEGAQLAGSIQGEEGHRRGGGHV